jgi:uncharacterized YccA/Bax inhibitor family protein
MVRILVGYHLLLLRDVGPYVIIFTNVCVVITLASDYLLLRDFGLCGMIL